MSASVGYVIVFVGAGAGGALRHAVNRLAAAIPGGFPWATMIVNMTWSPAAGRVVAAGRPAVIWT